MNLKELETLEKALEEEVKQAFRWGESKKVVIQRLGERYLAAEDDSAEEEALLNILDRLSGWCPPFRRL